MACASKEAHKMRKTTTHLYVFGSTQRIRSLLNDTMAHFNHARYVWPVYSAALLLITVLCWEREIWCVRQGTHAPPIAEVKCRWVCDSRSIDRPHPNCVYGQEGSFICPQSSCVVIVSRIGFSAPTGGQLRWVRTVSCSERTSMKPV